MPVQLECSLFSHMFNPKNARLGNKILRQRLRGPSLAAYYPRKTATIEDIQQEFKKLDLVTWNEKEEDRLEGLQIAKLRGKGAPKKKRTAEGEFSPCIPTNGAEFFEWVSMLMAIIISKQEEHEKEVGLRRHWKSLLYKVYFVAMAFGSV